MQIKTTNKGFTLLEILLVIALIGILVSILLIAINPNRQLAEARNLNRIAHINDIYKALDAYSIRNSGAILTGITTSYQEICNTGTESSSSTATSCIGKLDLRVLVPTYITSIPRDTQAGTGNTGYEVAKDNKNQISIRAKNAELGEVVAVNAPSDTLYSKAGAFPSLDLNFASNKSLIDNVSGKNLITFARNSIGTYVGSDGLIKTAAVNEPRFDHNPTTGESLGLLVEEERTNWFTNSPLSQANQFAYPDTWGGWNPAIFLRSQTLSPDGVSFGVFHGAVNQNGGGVRKDLTGLSVSANYTISFWAKSLTNSELTYFTNNNSKGVTTGNTDGAQNVAWFSATKARFDTTNLNGTGASGNGQFVLSNTWQRFSGNIISDSSGSIRIIISNNVSDTGTGNEDGGGVWVIWGVQLEQGSFPTSYIPTSGSIVTRQADNVSITGSNFSSWYNQNEGSIFTKFKGGRESQQNGYGRIISPTGAASLLSTNNFTNSLSIWFGGSAINFNGISNVDYWNVGNTASIAYNNTNTIIVKGGQSATGNIKPSDAGTINSWQLGGNNFARTNMLNGTISRLTYWPTRLPNSNLQAMTQ